MILSQELLLSDDQDLAQATGDHASTNYIDLGAADTPHGGAAALRYDMGPGEPVPIEAMVTEAFDSSTDTATVNIKLQVDDNTSFSSPTTVYETGAVGEATLVQGYNLPIMYLPEGVDERYVRILYTIGGEATTAGKITAGISGGRQTNQ